MSETGLSRASSVADLWDSAWSELLGPLTGELPADLLPSPAATRLEQDPVTWLTTLFPETVSAGFAPHHLDFWGWVWSLRRGVRPPPFVAIWPRGGAKSSSAELGVIAAGALRTRRYVLYVSATQDLADKHIADIARRLESDAIARYYPGIGQREISKYGISRGWSGSRLRTRAGLMIDALGLNAAVRGLKSGDARPDLIVLDDIDHLHDSPATTAAKIETITSSILPARSTDGAVLAVQNLIAPDSIFSRLAGVSEHTVDFLADRIVSGPHPAVDGLVTEQREGRTVITHGRALWQGQDLQACQDAIDTYGLTAFLRESQHEVSEPDGGMFSHIDFRHCDLSDVPELVETIVAVDPAVTDTDQSDSHGIQVDGVAEDGTIYRLWSWERRASPEYALTLAIKQALVHGALRIVIETNQGGDLWQTVYDRLIAELRAGTLTLDGAPVTLADGQRPPILVPEKATSGTGSKAERGSRMLTDYERGQMVHVIGTHQTLERALRRFPLKKPFDLVDCAYYAWDALRSRPTPLTVGPVSLTRVSPYRGR